METEGTLLAKSEPFEVGEKDKTVGFTVPQNEDDVEKIMLRLDDNFGGEIYVRLQFHLMPEWAAAGEGEGPTVIYRPSSGQDTLTPSEKMTTALLSSTGLK